MQPPNGLRYPRVGGMRQRHFAGTSLKPRKPPENAVTPTRRVHAVLGGFFSDESIFMGGSFHADNVLYCAYLLSSL